MFKKLEGKTAAGNERTLFRAMAVSAEQMKLVSEIRALYDARETEDEETAKRYASGHYTRKELRDAHGELRGKRAAPYFISKNAACKLKNQHGMYNVTVLKERKGDAVVVKDETLPETTKRKKESKPKRESKKKLAAPASTEVAVA